MTESLDSYTHAAMQGNFSSEIRLGWGCQLAFPIFALSSFLPLGLLYPFTDSLAAVFFASFLFDLLLAFVANIYRRKAPDQTLRRAIAAWLVVLAPCFALMFFALWVGETFGL